MLHQQCKVATYAKERRVFDKQCNISWLHLHMLHLPLCYLLLQVCEYDIRWKKPLSILLTYNGWQTITIIIYMYIGITIWISIKIKCIILYIYMVIGYDPFHDIIHINLANAAVYWFIILSPFHSAYCLYQEGSLGT